MIVSRESGHNSQELSNWVAPRWWARAYYRLKCIAIYIWGGFLLWKSFNPHDACMQIRMWVQMRKHLAFMTVKGSVILWANYFMVCAAYHGTQDVQKARNKIMKKRILAAVLTAVMAMGALTAVRLTWFPGQLSWRIYSGAGRGRYCRGWEPDDRICQCTGRQRNFRHDCQQLRK